MLKKIKDLQLSEFLENENRNKSLFETEPALKRALDGIIFIGKSYGPEMAATIWTNTVDKFPQGVLELPYIIEE